MEKKKQTNVQQHLFLLFATFNFLTPSVFEFSFKVCRHCHKCLFGITVGFIIDTSKVTQPRDHMIFVNDDVP